MICNEQAYLWYANQFKTDKKWQVIFYFDKNKSEIVEAVGVSVSIDFFFK